MIAIVVMIPNGMFIMKLAAIIRPSMKLCTLSPIRLMWVKVCTSQWPLWQCLHFSSLSIRKNSENPISTDIHIFVPVFSSASGSRCRNAPPISAPAANPTISISILSSFFALIEIVTIPISERMLTNNVLAIIQSNVSIS